MADSAPKSERGWLRLVDAAVILALLPAVLYLLGSSQIDGFCDEFGLPPDLFRLDVHQTLMFGFFSSFFGAGALSVVLLAALSIIFACRRWYTSRLLVEASHPFRLAFLFPGSFIVASLVLFAAYSVAHIAGHHQARLLAQQLKREALRPECLPSIETATKTYQGFLFFCSPTHCGLLVGEDTVVIPRGAIERVINRPCK